MNDPFSINVRVDNATAIALGFLLLRHAELRLQSWAHCGQRNLPQTKFQNEQAWDCTVAKLAIVTLSLTYLIG